MSQTIYRYVSDGDVYDCLRLKRRPDYDVLSEVAEQPAVQEWTPLKATFYRVGREGDFPYLAGSTPAFSQRALEALSPLLDGMIEPLPLETPSGNYFAIHVLELLDALDLERSEIEWLDDDRILNVETFVFKPEVVKGKHIFKIRQHALAFSYVSEEFKQAVEASALEGLVLEEVWTSTTQT